MYRLGAVSPPSSWTGFFFCAAYEEYYQVDGAWRTHKGTKTGIVRKSETSQFLDTAAEVRSAMKNSPYSSQFFRFKNNILDVWIYGWLKQNTNYGITMFVFF